MKQNFEPIGTPILNGHYVALRPVDWTQDGDALAAHLVGDDKADIWDFMSIGPFASKEAYIDAVNAATLSQDLTNLAITRLSDRDVVGTASFMRKRPEHGSVEIGFVTFSHSLQRSREATEAIYLMIAYALGDLGYRRLEWKCNAANDRSRKAARRFGFTFEGVFRQDMISKGRNRDTAWFSVLDSEWPRLKAGYQAWLDPGNFTADGAQKTRLEAHFA